MATYTTTADAQTRISLELLLDLFHDEMGPRGLTPTVVARIDEFLLDAESDVEQVIRTKYGAAGLTAIQALGTSAPRAVKRLTLDRFEIRAYRRHPQYIRAQWEGRERSVQMALDALLIDELQLDTTGSTEPAGSAGAAHIVVTDESDIVTENKVTWDDMGAF